MGSARSNSLLAGHYLVDPALVATAFEARLAEGLQRTPRHALAGDAGAKDENVGVIVHARHPGSEAIGGERCPGAIDLIGRHGDAVAGTADQETEAGVGDDPPRDRATKIRVIHRVQGIGAEIFDLTALKRIKAGMPAFQWNSQYQQNPTSEEGSIVKREWWQVWRNEKPPACDYIISSLDAAAEKNNRADYTALTTWGVFTHEETGVPSLILLNSIKERLEFPELKELCLEHWKDWQPDSFIVEKKSAGVAIYQELRRMGIPLSEYTPHRGSGDKTARLNAVTDMISSGMVYAPATRWAEELIEEVAAFPFGSNDDLVDSMVMALMRFRQGGFIRLPSDMEDEPVYYRKAAAYY